MDIFEKYKLSDSNLFFFEFGDIIFSMERMNFVGAPVNVNEVAAPYNGSHRFYGNVGHVGANDFPNAAVDIAFGVLPENTSPKF